MSFLAIVGLCGVGLGGRVGSGGDQYGNIWDRRLGVSNVRVVGGRRAGDNKREKMG